MRLVVLSVLTVIALSACTASPPPQPTPTPEVSFEPTVVSGTGRTTIPLPLPDGAQSLHVEIGCVSDLSVTVDLGGQMEDSRDGQCGAVNTFVIPITDISQGALNVFVADGAYFTATLQFSADPVVPDADVAAQCSTVGEALSSIINSAEAVRHGESNATQWRAQIDAAMDTLATLDPDTMIGRLTVPTAALLTDSSRTYEDLMFDEGSQRLIAQLCANNGSTIAIRAQYGG